MKASPAHHSSHRLCKSHGEGLCSSLTPVKELPGGPPTVFSTCLVPWLCLFQDNTLDFQFYTL